MMLRAVNWGRGGGVGGGGGGGGGGSFFFLDCPSGCFWLLPWLVFCSDEPLAVGLLLWAVIITVCKAARMLSSSVKIYPHDDTIPP